MSEPAGTGIAILRTPYRTPQANAVCERFLGKRHLSRVLREYVAYFNRARPHQGLAQATPESSSDATGNREGSVRALPVLGGLHHDYRRAA